MGYILMGSTVNSFLLHSMWISPPFMGVSLGCWVLMGSMVDSPLLGSMGISPLSMGVCLGCWGSPGLSVCWLLGSVLLALDLFHCAGLAHCESFSLSMADFLSEMKLKASFNAMSQFTVLALIQSSKVLKGIDLLFVSTMVLKEGILLTSYPVSWKETFFLPDLPMVQKEIFLPLFLTVSLTLLASSFSLMTLMLSITGVFIGTNLRLFCSFLPCVLAGVLKGVSVHAFLMTHMPSTPRVLKGINVYLFCLFLSHVWAGVLKGFSVHVSPMTLMPSTSRVLKVINLYCSLLPCVFLAGVLKGVSVHIHIAMVLKELGGWSWKDFDATLWFLHCVLPSIFKQWS